MQRAFFWSVQPPKTDDKHVPGIFHNLILYWFVWEVPSFFQKCIIYVGRSQLEVTHMMMGVIFLTHKNLPLLPLGVHLVHVFWITGTYTPEV